MSILRFSAPLVAFVLLGACKSDREAADPGTTTVTGAAVSNDSAVARITAARCAREASCNNVGTDKRFTTQETCTQKIQGDLKNDLNAQECPRGIDQKELNECLAEIKSEDCNNPIDKIERLAACRTSDLCLKTAR